MSNKPQTIKVRIAVAVAPDGAWSAAGWRSRGPADEDLVMDSAITYNHRPGRISVLYWVTAELPIPVGVEVAGVVEPGGEVKSDG